MLRRECRTLNVIRRARSVLAASDVLPESLFGDGAAHSSDLLLLIYAIDSTGCRPQHSMSPVVDRSMYDLCSSVGVCS